MSVNTSPWTQINDQAQQVKISFEVENAENKPWKVWMSTLVPPGNAFIADQLIAEGSGNSWDNVSFENAIAVGIPENNTLEFIGNSTRIYKIFLTFTESDGTATKAQKDYYIVQKPKSDVIIETVIEEVQIPSKFITELDPEYSQRSFSSASSANESFTVKTSVEDCPWTTSIKFFSIFEQNPWVTIINGQGNGNGVVTYSVSENFSYVPRYAEIKVTTSEGNYRVFPIFQPAAAQPFVSQWGRRFLGPTVDDFNVNTSSWTIVSEQGEEIKVGFRVAGSGSGVENIPWKLYITPPITQSVPSPSDSPSSQIIAEGVGNSWDDVSYENAITLNIPPNPEVPGTENNPRVFTLFLNFIGPEGNVIPTRSRYTIVQKAQPKIITETVTVIEQVEIPSKFIKNVIPPFTIAQGIGGIFEMDVETSVEDCAWQASSDVDWVDLVANIVPGGALPPGERAVKLMGFSGNNKLKFQVAENNTSDVRIMVIPFKVFPNGFSSSPAGYQYGIFPDGFVDTSGDIANGSYIGVGSSLTELTDAQGMKWKIVDGVVKVNNENAGFTQNVVVLLWWDGKIYQSNEAGGWWRWDGDGVWTPIPEGDPRPDGFVTPQVAFVNGYHTVIQVPKPGGIRLIIDGKVDVIPTSTIPFNVNVTYQNSQSTPNP